MNAARDADARRPRTDAEGRREDRREERREGGREEGREGGREEASGRDFRRSSQPHDDQFINHGETPMLCEFRQIHACES